MPYLASGALRWGGVKRGDITLADGWRDGGTDPVCGLNMGQTAENVAARYGVSRADQDAWSLRCHQRVANAWERGWFASQVVDVPLADGDVLDRDEGFRTDTTAERLARGATRHPAAERLAARGRIPSRGTLACSPCTTHRKRLVTAQA